jgi:hypothetical protein
MNTRCRTSHSAASNSRLVTVDDDDLDLLQEHPRSLGA